MLLQGEGDVSLDFNTVTTGEHTHTHKLTHMQVHGTGSKRSLTKCAAFLPRTHTANPPTHTQTHTHPHTHSQTQM